MTRRLRCRVGLHKWVIRQDARDASRYYGCRFCDKMMGNRPLLDMGGGI